MRKLREATEEMKGDRDVFKATAAQDGEYRAAPTLADRFTGKRPARPQWKPLLVCILNPFF